MTPEQRQAALERCEKTPPPPWDVEVQWPHSKENSCPAVTDAEGRVLFDAGNADYRLGNTQGYDADEDGVSYWFEGPSVDAMEFACHARVDLPAALAHITEVEARIVELEQWLRDEKISNDALEKWLHIEESKCKQQQAHITELEARFRELSEQTEFDRTAITDAWNAILDEIKSRRWICFSRGPYEWDDDRYRKEFTDAAAAIEKACGALESIAANLKGTPTTTAEVIAARVDLKTRIAELEADNARLRAALDQIKAEANSGGDDRTGRIYQIANVALKGNSQ